MNCVKESPLTYEAFAEAVQVGDSSPEAFQHALQGSQMPIDVFRRYLPEYQRYMALCAHYPNVGMTSTGVDALWHAHMLISDRYAQFSELLGTYVHHMPCSLYPIYGVSQATARDSCLSKCVPASCKGSGGGCKKDDRDADPEATRQGILSSSLIFVQAYTEAFGIAPSKAIWDQLI